MIRAALPLLLCALLAGCAPALREPPSLVEMAGGSGAVGREEGERLLAEADSLLRRPDLGSMRAAADRYMSAAAGGVGGNSCLLVMIWS